MFMTSLWMLHLSEIAGNGRSYVKFHLALINLIAQHPVRRLYSREFAMLLNGSNVTTFGAVGNGTTDDTAAIQTAINAGQPVYFPKGTYLVTNALTVATAGQILYGDGRDFSTILVNATFNMAAAGIFSVASGASAIEWRDLGISCVQPAGASTRAALTAYPPAIRAFDAPRLAVRCCRIALARTGLDWRGNCGQSTVDDLQMSAFDYGIRLDGALDTVTITKLHSWPYDVTPAQYPIFLDPATIGLHSGRVDDLILSDSLFFSGTAMKLVAGVTGSTFGDISNTDFDAQAVIEVQTGNITMSSCHFTSAIDARKIYQAGGSISITAGRFYIGAPLSTQFVLLEPPENTSATFVVSGSVFETYTYDVYLLWAQARGNVVCTGNSVIRAAAGPFVKALFTGGAGSRLSIVGNQISNASGTSSPFNNTPSNDRHMFTNNTAAGYSFGSGGPLTIINSNITT